MWAPWQGSLSYHLHPTLSVVSILWCLVSVKHVIKTQPNSSWVKLAFTLNAGFFSALGAAESYAPFAFIDDQAWSGHTGRTPPKKGKANWFSFCQDIIVDLLASCYHQRANEGTIDFRQIKAACATLLIVRFTSIMALVQHLCFICHFKLFFRQAHISACASV